MSEYQEKVPAYRDSGILTAIRCDGGFDRLVLRESGNQGSDRFTIDQADQVAFVKYVENTDWHMLIPA